MTPVQRLGWSLIHSTWEIALCALVLALASLLLRHRSAKARYAFALLALLASLLAPVATFVSLPGAPPTSPAAVQSSTPAKAVPALLPNPAPPTEAPESVSFKQRVDPALPFLVDLWLVGLAAMALRMAGGLIAIERLKRRAIRTGNDRWQELAADLAQRFQVRRALEVRTVSHVDSPMVVGLMKSVVLLPASMLTKLSPQDVEALIAHEIAHIRRHDYLVNLLQSVVEAILFYHPAIWWISSVIRRERENCCDDLVVVVLENRKRYAQALAGLEELRASSTQLALRAGGSSLGDRIRRILLVPPRRTLVAPGWLAVAATVLIAGGLMRTLPARQASPHAEESTSVRGRVLSPDGRPIEGALVVGGSLDPVTGMPREVETTTNAAGEYDLTGIRPGPFGLCAHIKGFGIGFAMSRLANPSQLDIRLTAPANGTVRVVAEDRKPVAGVRVFPEVIESVREKDARNSVAYGLPKRLVDELTSTTGPDGLARFNDLPKGSRVIFSVMDDRYANARKSFGAELVGLNGSELVVQPGCSVKGTVLADGKPVADALVYVMGQVRSMALQVKTDANGAFVMKGLGKGDARIQTILPRAMSDEWVAPTPSVRLEPGKEASTTIRLERGGLVIVHVDHKDGHAVRQSTISCADASPSPSVISGVPSHDGVARIRLPSGAHRVYAAANGDSDSKVVNVKTGETQEVTLVMLSASEVGTVDGLVLDAAGHPVPRMFVQYKYEYEPGRTAQSGQMTDDHGVFSIQLPKRVISSVRFDANKGNLFTDPEVAPKDGKVTLRLHAVALASIQGVVADASGHPISGAHVMLGFSTMSDKFLGDLEGMGKWEKVTNSDGRFQFGSLYPGVHVTLMATAPGHADAQTILKPLAGGKVNVAPTFRLARAGTITGKVVDQNGQPVEKASVWIEGVVRVRNTRIETGPDGRFTIDRVPFGHHNMAIYKGYNEIHVAADTGRDKVYKITLKPNKDRPDRG